MVADYKRSDLGEMVGGKYAKRIRESTNVVLLDPQVAKATAEAASVAAADEDAKSREAVGASQK